MLINKFVKFQKYAPWSSLPQYENGCVDEWNFELLLFISNGKLWKFIFLFHYWIHWFYFPGIGGTPHLPITDYSAPSSSGDVSVAVSSAAASLQQLNLHKEELGAPPVDNNPAVIIPDHLQVPTADCSHLSFGSFGSGLGAPFTGSFASKSLQNNLEDVSVSADVSSAAADGSSLEHTTIRSCLCSCLSLIHCTLGFIYDVLHVSFLTEILKTMLMSQWYLQMRLLILLHLHNLRW